MYCCGLDVPRRTTAVCVVDGDGRIVEAEVVSDPEAIAELLRGLGLPLERIGLEARATAAWLQAGLRGRG